MQKDDGTRMICCEICEEWFHSRCVGRCEEEKIFVCNRCTKGDGNIYISEETFKTNYQTPPTKRSHLQINFEKINVASTNHSKYRNLYRRILSDTHHCRSVRLEMQEDIKPWTVACLQNNPRFVVGASDGSLGIYAITPEADFIKGHVIPDYLTLDDGHFVGAERISLTTTGHPYGLSYVYIPSSDDCVISSNWVDGTLIVSCLVYEYMTMKSVQI
jgi:hypothetical protein